MDEELRKAFIDASTQEEVTEENTTSSSNLCRCKSTYLVGSLNVTSFPKLFQHENILKLIQLMSQLTVRIHYRFQDESDNYVENYKYCRGSGFVQRIRKEISDLCPCLECTAKSDKDRAKVWFKLTITTTRPVFGHYRAGTNNYALADLFYDIDKDYRRQVVKIFGSEFEEANGDENDWGVCFAATHDEKLAGDLSEFLKDYEALQGDVYQWYKNKKAQSSRLVVIVGHPHGGPKKVSIGTDLEQMIIKDDRSGKVICRYAYDAVTCPGSSGSPVYICGQAISGFGYWFGHPHNHIKGGLPLTLENSDSMKHYNFSSTGMDLRE